MLESTWTDAADVAGEESPSTEGKSKGALLHLRLFSAAASAPCRSLRVGA